MTRQIARKKDTGEAGNGGQFGTTGRGEADVEFDAPDTTMYRTVGWTNKRLNEHFDASALLTRSEVDARKELLLEEDLFEVLQEEAERQCARRGSMELVDEITQEAALDIIKRMRDSEDPGVKAAATKALVNRIVSGHIYHRISHAGDEARSEQRAAEKKLKARIADIEQEEHRHVGEKERARLAEEIRMSFPAGRRPDPNFHTGVRFKHDSIDSEDWREDVEVGDPTADAALRSSTEPYDNALSKRIMEADEMLWHLTNREDSPYEMHSRNTASLAWNVIAQTMRIPPAKQNTMQHRHAMQCSKLVASHDRGAAGVASDYLEGVKDERVKALFAPFGRISHERRTDVAEMLESQPSYADDLWASALRTADSQRDNFEFEPVLGKKGKVRSG